MPLSTQSQHMNKRSNLARPRSHWNKPTTRSLPLCAFYKYLLTPVYLQFSQAAVPADHSTREQCKRIRVFLNISFLADRMIMSGPYDGYLGPYGSTLGNPPLIFYSGSRHMMAPSSTHVRSRNKADSSSLTKCRGCKYHCSGNL